MAPKSRSSTSKALKAAPVKLGTTSTKPSHTASNKKSTPATSSKATTKEDNDEMAELDVSNFKRLYQESRQSMGKPIHDDDWLPVHLVLRVFDCTEDYGPASNMTRLQRWERAKRLGLNPPEEIGTILRTKPALTRPDLRDPVFII